jgi:Putative zinc-finger
MKLSLTCDKVAALLSRSMDEPLGIIEQLRLKHHLLFCADCRHVDEQFKQLNGAMQSPFELGNVVNLDQSWTAKKDS